MLGNMKFIYPVISYMFNTRNKFHISAQPCNILSIFFYSENLILINYLAVKVSRYDVIVGELQVSFAVFFCSVKS